MLVSLFGSWGEPYPCASSGSCFCEHVDLSRLIAEPINAWSNLFYVGAGMIVLLIYDMKRNDKFHVKDDYLAKKENQHYMLTYGLLVIWIGVGSFLMHATWRGQTAFLDVLSMNMFLTAVFLYSISAVFNADKKIFYLSFVVISIINWFLMEMLGRLNVFTFWVVITFLNELAVSFGLHSKLFKGRGIRQIKRNSIFIVSILGLFLFAYYIWHFGYIDHPYCDPYSLWQWHTLWHFFTALCTFLIFLYLRTEKEIQ